MDERVVRWSSEVRVLDGGMGSECQRRSSLAIDGHKAWSCLLLKEDPNLVCDIHKSYLRAGADVIATNTYQAAPDTLTKALHVSKAEAVELMRHAVRLARRAITAVSDEVNYKPKLTPLIAGSLGPYGACLADGSEYTGEYVNSISFGELVDFHYERAQILIEAGVDLLAWETFPVVKEISAVCEVMRRIPGALSWVSVASSNGRTTVGGDPLQQVADEIQKCNQIFGVGVNCCVEHDRIGIALSHFLDKPDTTPGTEDGFHPPIHMQATDLSSTHKHKRKLLVLYANSGELWMPTAGRKCRKGAHHWVWPPDKGPTSWVKEISKWSMQRSAEPMCNTQPLLAQWVGGCCRVEPDQIHQLALHVKPDEFVQKVTSKRVLRKRELQSSASTTKSPTRKQVKFTNKK